MRSNDAVVRAFAFHKCRFNIRPDAICELSLLFVLAIPREISPFSFLRSLRFLVFVFCVFDFPYCSKLCSSLRMHAHRNNFSSQIGLKTFSMFYNNGI